MRAARGLLTGWLLASMPAPGTTAPYLRWSFTEVPMPDGGGTWYHQDSVSWVGPSGTTLWERRLPERMRRHQAGIGQAEVDAYRAFPRDTRHLYFLVGVIELEDAVVVADSSGLLALAKAGGSLLLDFEAGGPGEGASGAAPEARERLWFDAGTYTISGGGRCKGPARGGRFLADCGTRLVYFNGSTLAVFSKVDLRPLGRVAFESTRHERTAKGARVAARMRLLDLEIALDGTVYLR